MKRKLPCHLRDSLLHSFLDGEVSGSQSIMVSIHMRRCPECDWEAHNILLVRAALRRTQTADPAAIERLRRFVQSLG